MLMMPKGLKQGGGGGCAKLRYCRSRTIKLEFEVHFEEPKVSLRFPGVLSKWHPRKKLLVCLNGNFMLVTTYCY